MKGREGNGDRSLSFAKNKGLIFWLNNTKKNGGTVDDSSFPV
jgi:hypothetical protein